MRHYFLKCRTVLVHNGFAILCDYNQRRNQLKREVSDEANLFTVTQGVDICHCLEALLGPVLFTQLLVALRSLTSACLHWSAADVSLVDGAVLYGVFSSSL